MCLVIHLFLQTEKSDQEEKNWKNRDWGTSNPFHRRHHQFLFRDRRKKSFIFLMYLWVQNCFVIISFLLDFFLSLGVFKIFFRILIHTRKPTEAWLNNKWTNKNQNKSTIMKFDILLAFCLHNNIGLILLIFVFTKLEEIHFEWIFSYAGCPEIIASDKITAVKIAADIMQSGLNSIRS